MIGKITGWIMGTADVSVSGDAMRFINVMVRSGVTPLRVQRSKEGTVIRIRASKYKKLHGIKKRTGARVRLLKRSGLPFFVKTLLRRPGIPAGAVLGASLFLWLSGHYWCVDIRGEVPYARSAVEAAAKESGVFIGAAKENVDLPTAAAKLVGILPEIAWASFNSEGCTVVLECKASKEKAEGAGKDGLYDIVAARSGVVRSIAAERGTVLTEMGAVVLQGQTLVSGITPITDRYDPNVTVRHLLSRARAKIMAETRHTFSASCPLQTESMRERETGTRRVLYILGLQLPLSLTGAAEGELSAYSTKPLRLLGTTLPVWVEEQRCAVKETVKVTFTEEEARRRVYEELRQLEENCLGETGELLHEEVEFILEDGVLYGFAKCTVLEDIAVAVPAV